LRGGEQAMASMLARRPLPTAVFCMSDEMAFGAIRAVQRARLVPGRDIALIGFDGHELCDAFDLSTIEQPVRELGQLAAETVMRRIAGVQEPEVLELPTVLTVRGSTDASPN